MQALRLDSPEARSSACKFNTNAAPAMLRMLLTAAMALRASRSTTWPSASSLKVNLSGRTPDCSMRGRVMEKLRQQQGSKR